MERKNGFWTRKRIEYLILLYKKHECLWNHSIESYKNKNKRAKAMDVICSEIEISRPEFMKKIHNLRNQFNSEYKKYERRLEEAGESENGSPNTEYKSRWCHFESLMFLRNVISPRPGYHATDNLKKTQIEPDNEEVTEFYDDDGDFPSDFFQPTPQDQGKRTRQLGTVIELTTDTEKNTQCQPVPVSVIHDQWSAFGDFIANELRNYNSDLSRRKLKRKIMQAMLEVSEDDEN